jgi:4-hydroxybenzoate polyprenyltransferase
LRLLKQRPWALILVPVWLLRGRATLKRKISELVHLDAQVLPINEELMAWLRIEKQRGRSLVLATASDRNLTARAVAHLELFDLVLASSGNRNLKGRAKLEAIVQNCGAEFDYAGNSRTDLPIWRASREAILVNANPSVDAAARRSSNVTCVFPSAGGRLKAAIQSLRLYQWLKNLLIFVPAFTSHQGVHGQVLLKSALAFLAFGMCASAVYVANDLLDLEEDRQHASKKNRPFASAACSISTGVLVGGLSLAAGLGLAAWMADGLLPLLLLYILLTTCYSLWLKKALLLDVMTLAILYTVRIIVGHVVTGVPFSAWLSSFTFFLFLSLAFSKRATELIRLRPSARNMVPGRGYSTVDLQVMMTAGISSGFLSSLVLALYINSDSVKPLYKRPDLLWAVVPLLLYYIGRVWIACGRGELDDDPIVYSAKTPSTYFILAAVLLVVIAATVDWF